MMLFQQVQGSAGFRVQQVPARFASSSPAEYHLFFNPFSGGKFASPCSKRGRWWVGGGGTKSEAHTCTNTLELPNYYESLQALLFRLLVVLAEEKGVW